MGSLLYNLQTGIGAICFVICVVFLICLAHGHKTLSRKRRSEGCFYRISVSVTFAAMLWLCLALLIYVVMGFPMSPLAWHILNGLLVTLYQAAEMSMFVLLMSRHYFVFADTVYASPDSVYLVFALLLLLYFVFVLAWVGSCSVYIGHLYYSGDTVSFATFSVSAVVSVLGIEVVDLVLSLFLILAFIEKMLSVTVRLSDEHSTCLLNEKQQRLLDCVSKYFVLSFVATLSTQLASLLWSLYWLAYIVQNAEMQGVLGDWLWPTLLPLDCVVNTVCLFLIFERNTKWYHVMCWRCHACVVRCFRKTTTRKITIHYALNNVELHETLIDAM